MRHKDFVEYMHQMHSILRTPASFKLFILCQEEVIHMKLEDDEEYEAPEPGEIVDEPEGKPVSGPVLSAPPPSPLPSLEALIRPRQDLVPQQRTFPLPFSAGGKPASQSNDRGNANLLNTQPVSQ